MKQMKEHVKACIRMVYTKGVGHQSRASPYNTLGVTTPPGLGQMYEFLLHPLYLAQHN